LYPIKFSMTFARHCEQFFRFERNLGFLRLDSF